MFVDIGKISISIDHVVMVGNVFGDQSMRRYTVQFLNGETIEILEEVKSREDFLVLLKQEHESLTEEENYEKAEAIIRMLCEQNGFSNFWVDLDDDFQESIIIAIDHIIKKEE